MYILLGGIEPYSISVNIAVLKFMAGIASPFLNRIMASLTESYLLMLPLLAIYMFARRDKNVYVFVVAVVLFYIVGDIIKYIVREPRPCNSTAEIPFHINVYSCETNYSFPSNHATVLTGLPAFLGRYRYIRPLYIVWLLLVLFGKLYLGSHYFTDIVAGVLLSLAMVYILYRYKDRINNYINKILGRIIPLLSIK